MLWLVDLVEMTYNDWLMQLSEAGVQLRQLSDYNFAD